MQALEETFLTKVVECLREIDGLESTLPIKHQSELESLIKTIQTNLTYIFNHPADQHSYFTMASYYFGKQYSFIKILIVGVFVAISCLLSLYSVFFISMAPVFILIALIMNNHYKKGELFGAKVTQLNKALDRYKIKITSLRDDIKKQFENNSDEKALGLENNATLSNELVQLKKSMNEAKDRFNKLNVELDSYKTNLTHLTKLDSKKPINDLQQLAYNSDSAYEEESTSPISQGVIANLFSLNGVQINGLFLANTEKKSPSHFKTDKDKQVFEDAISSLLENAKKHYCVENLDALEPYTRNLFSQLSQKIQEDYKTIQYQILFEAFFIAHPWAHVQYKSGDHSFVLGFIKNYLHFLIVNKKQDIAQDDLYEHIISYPVERFREQFEESKKNTGIYSQIFSYAAPFVSPSSMVTQILHSQTDPMPDGFDLCRFLARQEPKTKHRRIDLLQLSDHAPFIARDNLSKTYYVPETYQIPEESILEGYKVAKIAFFISLAEEPILAKLKFDNPISRWHAVLFSRVYPGLIACREIKKYRENVPFLILLQEMLDTFCFGCHFQKQISEAFTYSHSNPILKKICEREDGQIKLDTKTLLDLRDKRAIEFIYDVSTRRYQNIVLNFNFLTEYPLKKAFYQILIHMPSSLTLSFKGNDNNDNLEKIKKFFSESKNYDLSILEHIQDLMEFNLIDCPIGFEHNFSSVSAYVARNKYLKKLEPNSNQNNNHEVKKTWAFVGQNILNYFKSTIPLERMRELDTYGYNKQNDELLNEISGMGTEGLKQIFDHLHTQYTQRWNNEFEGPKPNLNFLFDATGSLYSIPYENIDTLANYIQTFRNRQINGSNCAPLFAHFGLILHKKHTKKDKDAIIHLISVLNERNKAYPQELEEFVLYAYKVQAVYSEPLLEQLSEMSNSLDCTLEIMIRIPALDVLPNDDPRKIKYLGIQNAIKDNISVRQARQLEHSIRLLNNSAAMITTEPETKRPEKKFPLRVGQVQVQLAQQQQQNNQQQQQQDNQQQQQDNQQQQDQRQKNVLKSTPRIRTYEGCEEELITRQADGSLPNSENVVPKLQNILGKNLHDEWDIDKIEPAALSKIAQFQSELASGLSPNTAGFYVAISDSNPSKFILCFSSEQETLDVNRHNNAPIEDRDPFFVYLRLPNKPKPYRGDPRQLVKFRVKLATPKTNTLLNMMSYNQPTHQTYKPQILDTTELLPAQAYWTKCSYSEQGAFKLEGYSDTSIPHDSLTALNELFFSESSDEKMTLSKENLFAFGQIAQRFDTSEAKLGTDSFLRLATMMKQHFSDDNFVRWKAFILNTTPDWSTLLHKDEINAVTESFVWFAHCDNRSDYIDLWWSLIEKQAKIGCTYISYADLWPAFKQVMQYIQHRKLSFAAQEMKSFIFDTSSSSSLNPKYFLHQLYYCLNAATKTKDAHDVQENILQNLAHINWGPNGLSYAMGNCHYRYWDACLHLDGDTENYAPDWYKACLSNEASKIDATVLTMRFASQTLQLNLHDFQKLKDFVHGVIHLGSPILYFLSAALAIHSDKVKDLNSTLHETLALVPEKHYVYLDKINNLLWDQDRFVDTLQLRLENLPLLLTALEKAATSLDTITLDVLNVVGRALRSLKYAGVLDETKLDFALCCVKIALKNPSDPMISLYPWLLLDVNKLSSNLNDPYEESKHDICTDIDKEIDQLRKNAAAETGKSQGFIGLGVGPSFTLQSKLKSIQNDINILNKRKESLNAFSTDTLHRLNPFNQAIGSIDLETSKSYPNHNELKTAYYELLKTQNSEETVNDIIKDFLSKDYSITRQNSKFTKIDTKNSEFVQLLNEYHSKQRPNFKQYNEALIEEFFKYCVVQSDQDLSSHAKQLLERFTSLDSRNDFNELGQVLQILISLALSKSGCYPISHLTMWLQLLIDTKSNRGYFPFYCLISILQSKNSTLLNGNFNLLRDKYDNQVAITVEKIIKSRVHSLYKKIVIELILHFKDQTSRQKIEEVFAHISARRERSKFLDVWFTILSETLIEENTSSVVDDYLELLNILTCKFDDLNNENLWKAWEHAKLKLIKMLDNTHLQNRILELKAMLTLFKQTKSSWSLFGSHTPLDPKIKIIFIEAIEHWKVETVETDVLTTLKKLTENQLIELVQYYQGKHKPTLLELNGYLKNSNPGSVSDYFELQNISHLREYSLKEENLTGIHRVLSGIKCKGQGYLSSSEQYTVLNLLYYVNGFSIQKKLGSMPLLMLQNLLLSIMLKVRNKEEHLEINCAEALACMREILLRKLKLWVNHTQMITLIYASLYNDQGMLYQVRTGQGKSVITAMRVAYLALSGNVVDCLSSNESLSARDYEEFVDLIQRGFGIGCAHIKQNSNPQDYLQGDTSTGIGAIHYSTISSLGLFNLQHSWEGKAPRYNDKRIAFIDEIDDVVKNTTQLNYAPDPTSIHNLDEWAYRIIYDFYIEKFILNNHDEFINTKRDLEPLIQKLKKNVETIAPQASPFLRNYFNTPRLTNESESLLENQLIRMIHAAASAYRLQENQDYCLIPENKVLVAETGEAITIHAVHVVINNQLYPDAEYSDLVQQFLCLKCNLAAITDNKMPNCFISPETSIATSSNGPFIFRNKWYTKIEGCTGSAGNYRDLLLYDKLEIKKVIKLPTHLETKSKYLETHIVDNDDALIEKIQIDIDDLAKKQKMPILVLCDDDAEVLRLVAIFNKKHPNQYDVVTDMNASGISQDETVANAAHPGRVTFSARLNRGADIKPNVQTGLHVISTRVNALPTDEKQGLGRQGRAGNYGSCRCIINYSKIKERIVELAQDEDFNNIFQQEMAHLETKITKHSERNHNKQGHIKEKWLKIKENNQTKQRYLEVRSLAILNEQKKQGAAHFMQLKDQLLNVISDKFNTFLFNPNIKNSLQVNIVLFRRKFEEIWNTHLEGFTEETNDTYQAFLNEIKMIWEEWQKLHHDSTMQKCPDFSELTEQAKEVVECFDQNKNRPLYSDNVYQTLNENTLEIYIKFHVTFVSKVVLPNHLSSQTNDLQKFYLTILQLSPDHDYLIQLLGFVQNLLDSGQFNHIKLKKWPEIINLYREKSSLHYLSLITTCINFIISNQRHDVIVETFINILPHITQYNIEDSKLKKFIGIVFNAIVNCDEFTQDSNSLFCNNLLTNESVVFLFTNNSNDPFNQEACIELFKLLHFAEKDNVNQLKSYLIEQCFPQKSMQWNSKLLQFIFKLKLGPCTYPDPVVLLNAIKDTLKINNDQVLPIMDLLTTRGFIKSELDSFIQVLQNILETNSPKIIENLNDFAPYLSLKIIQETPNDKWIDLNHASIYFNQFMAHKKFIPHEKLFLKGHIDKVEVETSRNYYNSYSELFKKIELIENRKILFQNMCNLSSPLSLLEYSELKYLVDIIWHNKSDILCNQIISLYSYLPHISYKDNHVISFTKVNDKNYGELLNKKLKMICDTNYIINELNDIETLIKYCHDHHFINDKACEELLINFALYGLDTNSLLIEFGLPAEIGNEAHNGKLAMKMLYGMVTREKCSKDEIALYSSILEHGLNIYCHLLRGAPKEAVIYTSERIKVLTELDFIFSDEPKQKLTKAAIKSSGEANPSVFTVVQAYRNNFKEALSRIIDHLNSRNPQLKIEAEILKALLIIQEAQNIRDQKKQQHSSLILARFWRNQTKNSNTKKPLYADSDVTRSVDMTTPGSVVN